MSTWLKSSKCQALSKVYKKMTELPVLERLPTQWSPWSFSSALSLSSPQQWHWYVLGHSNVFFVEIFFDDISVPLSKCLGETSYPGDLHRDPGHNWFCWQHLLVPLHNCLWPQPQGFRPFFFCKYFTQALLPNNFLSSRWSIGDRARFTATQTPMASRRLRPSSLRWTARQSRLTILPL